MERRLSFRLAHCANQESRTPASLRTIRARFSSSWDSSTACHERGIAHWRLDLDRAWRACDARAMRARTRPRFTVQVQPSQAPTGSTVWGLRRQPVRRPRVGGSWTAKRRAIPAPWHRAVAHGFLRRTTTRTDLTSARRGCSQQGGNSGRRLTRTSAPPRSIEWPSVHSPPSNTEQRVYPNLGFKSRAILSGEVRWAVPRLKPSNRSRANDAEQPCSSKCSSPRSSVRGLC